MRGYGPPLLSRQAPRSRESYRFAVLASTTGELSLTHLNLDVANLDASERFYRDEFDLLVTRNAASLTIRMPAFLLVLAEGPPRVGGSFHFGFRVGSSADVDAWFARFRARGVTICDAPVDRGSVYSGRLRDADGYTIEIYCER